RADEGLFHLHLLVEHHADEQRERVGVQQLVGLFVVRPHNWHQVLPLFCTNWYPNLPFTHRWPEVTLWSSGDVTLTTELSCTCSSSMQPTPQYAHTVSVTVCLLSSHVPACRMSYSLLNISAPVGQTPMQLPQ